MAAFAIERGKSTFQAAVPALVELLQDMDSNVRKSALSALVALNGKSEHLAPVVDGEYYKNVRKVTFRPGPRVRIPKVVGRPRRH